MSSAPKDLEREEAVIRDMVNGMKAWRDNNSSSGWVNLYPARTVEIGPPNYKSSIAVQLPNLHLNLQMDPGLQTKISIPDLKNSRIMLRRHCSASH
jgi:hypothetical protein